MIPTCARNLRARSQQICHWSSSFWSHQPSFTGNRVLPTLLEAFLRSRDAEENEEKKEQVVLNRDETEQLNLGRERLLLNVTSGCRYRFHGVRNAVVGGGLRDVKQDAKVVFWLSRRWMSSDVRHGENDQKKKSEAEAEAKAKKKTEAEAEKRKRTVSAASGVEELPIHDEKPIVKQPIGQRIVAAFKKAGSMSREEWVAQLKKWKTAFLLELQHYWVGTKLLWAEIRISTRLLVKLSAGKPLTRREQLQLRTTASDIARLVPFIIIVIVPFMEFLLPVLLKVFPNMLPSTFQDNLKKEAELTKRLEARLQHAKLLQTTVLEMVDEAKLKHGETTGKDLDVFMTKVRTGQSINNSEILSFAKLFNDELTLDNISRPRLVSMCKYMGLRPYGTDAYLRYILRKKLVWIKSDDSLIMKEGIDSLSDAELRSACRERGMLVSLPPAELKQQLKNWLELSLEHSVPSSLLILSRAFVPEKLKPAEAVQATLLSLPDEVVHSVGVTALPSDDTLEERKRKLEVLKQQEEMIKYIQKEQQKQEQKMPKPKPKPADQK